MTSTTNFNLTATPIQKILVAEKILSVDFILLNKIEEAKNKMMVMRDDKNEGRPLRSFNNDVKSITEQLNLNYVHLYRIIECLETKCIDSIFQYLSVIEKNPEILHFNSYQKFQEKMSLNGLKTLNLDTLTKFFKELKDNFKSVLFQEHDNHFYFFGKAVISSNDCVQGIQLFIQNIAIEKQNRIDAENKRMEMAKQATELKKPDNKNNILNSIDARF